MARCCQRRQVRDRAAADKQAAGGIGHAAELSQPVERDDFNLGGARGFEPGSGEDVEASCQRFGHDTGEVARAWDKGEETRRVQVHDVAENVLLQLFQHLVYFCALLWNRFAQASFERNTAGSARNRLVAHLVEMFNQHVDDAIAKGAHLFGREFQPGMEHWIIYVDRCFLYRLPSNTFTCYAFL